MVCEIAHWVLVAYKKVESLMCILLGRPWDSILLAMLTVSPNRQYRGIRVPTTPAMTDPVWMPIRI